ncbi:MAG: hypothetical protein Q9159_000327 [Coniocarpon cinnabarinum]
MATQEVKADLKFKHDSKTTVDLYTGNQCTRKGVWHYRHHGSAGIWRLLIDHAAFWNPLNHEEQDPNAPRDQACIELQGTSPGTTTILITIDSRTGTFHVDQSNSHGHFIEANPTWLHNKLPELRIVWPTGYLNARYELQEDGKKLQPQIVTPSGNWDFKRTTHHAMPFQENVEITGRLPLGWARMLPDWYPTSAEGVSSWPTMSRKYVVRSPADEQSDMHATELVRSGLLSSFVS